MLVTVQAVREALQGSQSPTEGAVSPHNPSDAAAAGTTSPTRREAAVALIVRGMPTHNGGAEVLLIQRASNPRDPWSGHMAFPGGKRDPRDATLRNTATRETREEVGLKLSEQACFLGYLPTIHAISRGRQTAMTITPIVFELQRNALLALDYGEVQATFWTPLTPLLKGERNTQYLYRDSTRTLELPGFNVSGQTVWGLTHSMLLTLFSQLMSPRQPERPTL